MNYNEFTSYCSAHKIPLRYQPTRKRLQTFFDLDPGEKLVYYEGNLVVDIDKTGIKSVAELRDAFLLLITPKGQPFKAVPAGVIKQIDGVGLAHGVQRRTDKGFEYWAIRR